MDRITRWPPTLFFPVTVILASHVPQSLAKCHSHYVYNNPKKVSTLSPLPSTSTSSFSHQNKYNSSQKSLDKCKDIIILTLWELNYDLPHLGCNIGFFFPLHTLLQNPIPLLYKKSCYVWYFANKKQESLIKTKLFHTISLLHILTKVGCTHMVHVLSNTYPQIQYN